MGTLPIVHRVGGLVKVRDGVTGFSYAEKSEFWGAFQKSLELYSDKPQTLKMMQTEAFSEVLLRSDWPSILVTQYIPWLTEVPVNPIVSP
jgi:starch synthase